MIEHDISEASASTIGRWLAGTRSNVAPGIVHAAPARSLDGPTRDAMEQRFGREFGNVRVRADPLAA